jgi:hypothetical protein
MRAVMTLWCCGPECDQLTAKATEKQAAQLRKAQREQDNVVACQIVHRDKELS